MPHLLQARAQPDVTIKDAEGQTALHLACGSPMDQVASPGTTPPLQASEYQTATVVELLLGGEAGVHAKDETGTTPLMQVLRIRRMK